MLLIDVRKRLLRLSNIGLWFAKVASRPRDLTRRSNIRSIALPNAHDLTFQNVPTTKYFATVVAVALYQNAFDFTNLVYSEFEALAREVNKILRLGKAPTASGTRTAWVKMKPKPTADAEYRFSSATPFYLGFRSEPGKEVHNTRFTTLSVSRLLSHSPPSEPATLARSNILEHAAEEEATIFKPPPWDTANDRPGFTPKNLPQPPTPRIPRGVENESARGAIKADLASLARPLLRVIGTPEKPRNAKYSITSQVEFVDCDEIRELWALLGMDAFALREYRGKVGSYFLPLTISADHHSSATSSATAISEWVNTRRAILTRMVTSAYSKRIGAWPASSMTEPLPGFYSPLSPRRQPVGSLTTTLLATRGLRCWKSGAKTLEGRSSEIRGFLESMRTIDGGYAQNHDSPTGGIVLDEPRYTAMGIGITMYANPHSILHATMYLLSLEDMQTEAPSHRYGRRYAYNLMWVLWGVRLAHDVYEWRPAEAGVHRHLVNTTTLSALRDTLVRQLQLAGPLCWTTSKYASNDSYAVIDNIRECAICLDLMADLAKVLPQDYLEQSTRQLMQPIVEKGSTEPKATRSTLPYMPWLATSVAGIALISAKFATGMGGLLDAMTRYVSTWWGVKNVSVQHRAEIAAALMYGQTRISSILEKGKVPSFFLNPTETPQT
ncbi:MAG: hypothetical protein HS108_14640 [Planctomycetes bacterium]|nr:hypothetical protein [Planctomycetota bacterium]